MTMRDLEARYQALRAAHDRGHLSPEGFRAAVAELRMREADGGWVQLDTDGRWLRWDGRAWTPHVVSPRGQGAHEDTAESPGDDTLRCERCDAWLATPGRLCPDCEAGRPPRRRTAGPKFRAAKLLYFVPLLAIAWIWRDDLGDSGPVLALTAATVGLTIALRRTVAAALFRVASLPVFRPVWMITGGLPQGLRKLLGIAVPAFVAYKITPGLSRAFEGTGYLVFVVALSLSTFIAIFFFAPTPAGRRR